jgi:hypothetical protein
VIFEKINYFLISGYIMVIRRKKNRGQRDCWWRETGGRKEKRRGGMNLFFLTSSMNFLKGGANRQ